MAVRCWCKHCEAELSPSHVGKCPSCGRAGKRCEAVAVVAVGVSAKEAMSPAQRKEIEQLLTLPQAHLFHKVIEFVEENMEVDGFDIHFPGVTIKFKVKHKAKV
jgi:predicted ATP-dependent serine protease